MSVEVYNGIVIDYEKDKELDEIGLLFLTKKGFYKKDHENSPQETFARASTCYSFGDYGLAQRIQNYASNKWFANASPVLTNAIDIDWPTFRPDQFEEAGDWLEDNISADAMPISCFLSFIPDTKEGLVSTRHETAWLSMLGGGIGLGVNNRAPDEKSTGVMAHLKGYDADALSYKQTASRRGSIAAYLDVDHPEIMSFITMRSPVGGDFNKKCFNLNNAVNIPDKFMEAVIKGEQYELIDPKHGPTGNFLAAREVWEGLLEMREETGEPFLNFIDTVNRNKREWITKPTYHISQSNLCTEIHLMTSATRTAVCCLSSLNMEYYDEWKDTTIVQDLIRYLDNVLEFFIRLAPPALKRAVNSAIKERALGLGRMGMHALLQKRNIAFESGGFNSAAQLAVETSTLIEARAIEESKKLAEERGEAGDVRGSGMRGTNLLAIAPNASSSKILGTSAGIEPWAANAFMEEGRAGSFLVKNKYLEKVLDKYGLNTPETWTKIASKERKGSVQWIKQLTEHERDVYKTAREISPLWYIEHVSLMQPHVCQGISLNFLGDGTWTAQESSDIHMLAWKKGLKSLYYMRNEQTRTGSGSEEPLNALRPEIKYEECLACEG